MSAFASVFSTLDPALARLIASVPPLFAFGLGSIVEGITFDPEPAHIVGTGGAIGAVLRHLVYRQFSSNRYPWPTLTVNVVGSFVLGVAVFTGASESTSQLLGVGACGSFTTFSSFSVETVQLYERGDRRLAVANAASNLFVSLGAIGVAWILVGLW